jgi:hypothetical protein
MGHKETCKAVTTSGVILNELLCNCKRKRQRPVEQIMLNELHLRIYGKPGLTRKEVNTINGLIEKQLKWAAYVGSKFVSTESGHKVKIVISQ